jgi:hypothetical protein
LELTVQGWIAKHLSYAGHLELLRSVLFGKVHFWLNIFPMPAVVLHKIISICRNFLWTGDTKRNGSALVAWKFLYLPKVEGGLGLCDLKARNRSSLPNSFGIFILKWIWYGFVGCITFI